MTNNNNNTGNQLKNIFFGAIFAISTTITATGLHGDWWATALLLPTGAILGWKTANHI